MKKIGFFWLIMQFFITVSGFSNPQTPLDKNKNRIHVLDNQIANLQRNLSQDHTKRNQLNQELGNLEKQISASIVQLRHLQERLHALEKSRTNLEEAIKSSLETLKMHQVRLGQLVRARYLMNNPQPLKWLFHQENPATITRLFTYYHYLIQSRQKTMDDIQILQRQLDENNQKLQQEWTESKQLEAQYLVNQKKLEHDKIQRQNVVKILQQTMQTRESALKEAQRNKEQLAQIVKSLSTERSVSLFISQPGSPFANMRRKLPYPVAIKPKAVRRMNQGVTFFADEGSSVRAVHTGKVVFSEWLKGYGLLIIVDHGRGFMTLYAHNQALFKHKGQRVQQGEMIASVGHTGGLKENGLYFEVRQHGKVIPALAWFRETGNLA